MNELYVFAFCLGLGVAARALYLGASALAKRTDLIPVTVLLDALTVMLIGGAMTAFIILTSTVIAPYMFAALAAGYLLAYWLTHKTTAKQPKKKDKAEKVKVNR